jgi:hypothetical protein
MNGNGEAASDAGNLPTRATRQVSDDDSRTGGKETSRKLRSGSLQPPMTFMRCNRFSR